MDNRKQTSCSSSEDVAIRKGPWTMEEDLILMNYIATHGEGVWNSLAKAAGLKRTGKSCRLRWLNYLRPDVRRGNITQEEQILIMDLHAKWGNRWSKIAKNLPGRTDNEIKNFWRTRIQKQLKQGNANDNHHQHHYHQNNSGQSYDQSTGQSTSQLSSGSTHGGSHHDPYSASSYNTSTEHQPTMDTTFQLASGPGGYSVGGGQGYYFMQPPPPPSPPLPMDQEPTDQYWPHNIEAEFWPMHMGHMFNPDQGKPM